MDARVHDLHCIMPIQNLPSVMANGILSYERAALLRHASVAMQPVQDRRDVKRVPGGLRLHQYANLYFHARNPMLYKRLNEIAGLCVVSVSTEVLRTPGTVLTDCNAASDYVRFLDPAQHDSIVFDDVFSESWTHDDRRRYFEHKSRKCAEVLVPHMVPSALVRGAYVADAGAQACVANVTPDLRTKVVPYMFFR